jgi:hypothetical protein
MNDEDILRAERLGQNRLIWEKVRHIFEPAFDEAIPLLEKQEIVLLHMAMPIGLADYLEERGL